jgi:hypothetical protein
MDPKNLEAEIKQDTQIKQLLDMAFSEFKATIVEYKKRLDGNLFHAKEQIARLEHEKSLLRSIIIDLRKELEAIKEIVK